MHTLKHKRSGYTFVEVLVASGAAALLAGLVATTVQRSNAVFRQAGVSAEADTSVQRAVERIAREMMDADRSTLTLTPSPTLGADTVTFQRATGFGGGALQVGAMRRVRFEYALGETNDGADNNGNGLVDEGRVVLSTDFLNAGTEVVLVENVRELLEGEIGNGVDDNGNGLADESGLALVYDATTFTLTLRLTVSRIGEGGVVVDRTAETAVRIRND